MVVGVIVCVIGGYMFGYCVVDVVLNGDKFMFVGDMIFEVGFDYFDW